MDDVRTLPRVMPVFGFESVQEHAAAVGRFEGTTGEMVKTLDMGPLHMLLWKGGPHTAWLTVNVSDPEARERIPISGTAIECDQPWEDAASFARPMKKMLVIDFSVIGLPQGRIVAVCTGPGDDRAYFFWSQSKDEPES